MINHLLEAHHGNRDHKQHDHDSLAKGEVRNTCNAKPFYVEAWRNPERISNDTGEDVDRCADKGTLAHGIDHR